MTTVVGLSGSAEKAIQAFGIEFEWNQCWSKENCLRRIEEVERMEKVEAERLMIVEDGGPYDDEITLV